MPNQYSKLTADNIYRKLNRKNNPVTSLAGLAREFGINTMFYRATGTRAGQMDNRVPTMFREKVRRLVGTTDLNAIRRRKHINYNAEGTTYGW